MRVLYLKCQAGKNMRIVQMCLLRRKNKYSILTHIFLSGKCNIVFLNPSSDLLWKMYKIVLGVSWIILYCSIFYMCI